jgi:hypothetical protein
MENVLVHQGFLLAVIVAGTIIGFLLHRVLSKQAKNSEDYAASLSRLTDVFGFVSGAVGVLLGLLLSISVTAYQETEKHVDEFNASVVSVFHAVAVYPTPSKTAIRNDIICTVNTFYETEVHPQVKNTGLGNLDTTLWIAQLNRDIDHLPLETGAQTETYQRVLDGSLEMARWRQQILSTSTKSLPPIIWFVIYGAVLVLSILLSLSFADKRRFSLVTATLTYVTLALMIFGLSALDQPLHDEGLGGVVNASSMQDMIRDLKVAYPLQPTPVCPDLNPGQEITWP